jgi:hypothetical protein
MKALVVNALGRGFDFEDVHIASPIRREVLAARVLRRRGRDQGSLGQGVEGLAVGLRCASAGGAGTAIAVIPCSD